MISLTVTFDLPWPLQFQQRRHPRLAQPTVPLKPYSLAHLQAQADAQARSESEALWEVMMRPV
jgi:hypothetical protein